MSAIIAHGIAQESGSLMRNHPDTTTRWAERPAHASCVMRQSVVAARVERGQRDRSA